MSKRKLNETDIEPNKLCNNNKCDEAECDNKPLYTYEQDNKSYCDIHKKHKLIVQNSSDAVDIMSIQQWNGWCDIDKCKQCNGGPFSTTYEVNWILRCSNEQKYCSEMCYKCLKNLAKLDPDIQNEEYRKTNPRLDNITKKYGLA